MKHLLVKTLSVLLCAAMLCSVLCFSSSAFLPLAQAQALKFNSDSSFKILHLTDLHMHEEDDEVQQMSDLLIRKIVVNENPDLVVITGDIAMNSTLERTRENIDKLMTMFDELEVPVAVNFGNHDTESGIISREDLLSVYMQYDCCVAVSDGALPGAGTYNIPILSSDGRKIAFNLWMIDSGDYDSSGRYASTDKQIVSWYVNRSNELKALNGGEPVNSLMFQHIIVPEVYEAFKKTTRLNPFAIGKIYADKEYYVLDAAHTNSGRLVETACSPLENNGQFDAVVEQGDVIAMFFGHDHSNTFSVNCRGVDLVATPKAQFGLTSRNGSDFTDSAKGARVIVLNENDTSKYETRVVTFGSLYRTADLFNISDSFEKKTALRVIIGDVLYKALMGTATKLVEAITFSTIDFD